MFEFWEPFICMIATVQHFMEMGGNNGVMFLFYRPNVKRETKQPMGSVCRQGDCTFCPCV